MSLVSREPEGGDFERVDPGTYPARACLLVDLGTQRSRKFGNTDEMVEQLKVILGWELVGTDRGDGTPHVMTDIFTNSLHKKANLRLLLEAWRGKPFSEDERRGFNLRGVMGVPCLLGVVHKEKGESIYAEINGVLPPPAGMGTPEGVLPFTIFDITEPDWAVFDSLPEWMQKMVRGAMEFQEQPSTHPKTGTDNPQRPTPQPLVDPAVAGRPPGAAPGPFAPQPASLEAPPLAPGSTHGKPAPDEDAPF